MSPDQALGTLPYTGPSFEDSAPQALIPSQQPQAVSVLDAARGSSSNTDMLFWTLMVGVMAIPGLVLMTLIATVLIRR